MKRYGSLTSVELVLSNLPSHVHGQRHREVERIIGSLVANDGFVQIHRVFCDIHARRSQVERLSDGCDELNFIKGLDQSGVVRLITELLLKHVENCCIDHEGIVDARQFNVLQFVPTWLTTASLTAVHCIITNKEHSLELKKEKMGIAIITFIGEKSQRKRSEIRDYNELD